MKEIREFWSDIENVRKSSPEDIQSDVLAYLDLIEKRDAIIAYWEQRAKKWERAYENADRQYLNKEKEAAELRRMIEGREERLGIAIEEYNRLRKALEEAKAEYSKEGTDIQVLRRMIKIVDAALGEGDNH
ncbi:hypothetical protein P4H94_22905 [Paenibacillus macerans]|uniref:hypothetical protein n=1 Tax=Paenibacillus macerans TaxID=44252 RepID=UPI002DB8F4A1|nr:hypothetical protein [Paenibacillus macerans]MEC0139705.1 hypothetical protein [Paenibacillus macerans]